MLGSILTAAGVAAALTAGYQSMAPTGQWYGRTFTGLPRGSKLLALTYDDGPNDPYTYQLLEVLAKHNVKATFFLMGKYVRLRPDIVRDVVKAGHVIGNHTFTHPNLIYRSGDQVREELVQCRRAITDAVGEHSKLFRPPFGGRRPVTLRVVRELGLVPVMWNVTGYDWKATSAEYIEKRVTSKVCGGNVILLHDGSHRSFGFDRSRTVIATDRVITRYKAEGYEFVTVPEMMGREAVSSQLSALS
ncbi:MAG: polysaccharide deacetylase family protein [Terriglobales bacterium]